MEKKRATGIRPSVRRGYIQRTLLFLSLAILVSMPGVAKAAGGTGFDYNLGHGSLGISSESPGQSIRFSPVPIIPEKITPGAFTMKLGSSWANFWARGANFEMDYEILHYRVSASYGVSDRLSLSAGFEQKYYVGGAMDGFLIWFHDLAGLEQDGRDTSQRNTAHYFFRDAQGNVLVDSDDIGIFDNNAVEASFSYLLSPGSRLFPALNLSGTICTAMDTPLKGGGDPVDVAVGVGLSKRWSQRWLTYHQVTYTHFGRTELPHFSMKENGVSVINAAVWQWRPTLSISLQFMYTSGVIERIPDLKDPSNEAHIGMEWQVTKQGLLEAALIENVINYDNSPDFGVHLAYRYTPK